MKKVIRILIILIAIPVLYIGSCILLAYFTEFRPQAVQNVDILTLKSKTVPAVIQDSVLTFFTWNIGYGGLGAETDFFYDGGKMSISPKDWVQKYARGIFSTVQQYGDADFMFFQEADRKGKRSYDIDEVEGISRNLPDDVSAFALNYDVAFLPMPFLHPLGRIYGGMLSCSKFRPLTSQRVALPNITDFPRKLFYLKRCLLMQRFKLWNGKQLVVINTHFEAYDEGGKVKKEQMALTKKLMETEYKKGNYVVLGGDWNMAPPDFNVHKWEKEKQDDPLYLLKNNPAYIPGWKYASDNNTPSNRKNNHAFNPKTTYTTVIDYFFVSPNIKVLYVKGINTGFAYSDHNPVAMKIKLN
jgi:endonuclease/exonuclease/phosphatase family metal-dependent hydrolase